MELTISLGNLLTILIVVFSAGIGWKKLKDIPLLLENHAFEMTRYFEKGLTKLKEEQKKEINIIENKLIEHTTILKLQTEKKTQR